MRPMGFDTIVELEERLERMAGYLWYTSIGHVEKPGMAHSVTDVGSVTSELSLMTKWSPRRAMSPLVSCPEGMNAAVVRGAMLLWRRNAMNTHTTANVMWRGKSWRWACVSARAKMSAIRKSGTTY